MPEKLNTIRLARLVNSPSLNSGAQRSAILGCDLTKALRATGENLYEPDGL